MVVLKMLSSGGELQGHRRPVLAAVRRHQRPAKGAHRPHPRPELRRSASGATFAPGATAAGLHPEGSAPTAGAAAGLRRPAELEWAGERGSHGPWCHSNAA